MIALILGLFGTIGWTSYRDNKQMEGLQERMEAVYRIASQNTAALESQKQINAAIQQNIDRIDRQLEKH